MAFDYSLDFPNIDFRKCPERYQIGKGEQGVLLVQPYKSEILPFWRFKDAESAQASADKIYDLFEDYLRGDDFVGADMARKFLQMGYTRARRYANHRGGKKYAGPVPADKKRPKRFARSSGSAPDFEPRTGESESRRNLQTQMGCRQGKPRVSAFEICIHGEARALKPLLTPHLWRAIGNSACRDASASRYCKSIQYACAPLKTVLRCAERPSAHSRNWTELGRGPRGFGHSARGRFAPAKS